MQTTTAPRLHVEVDGAGQTLLLGHGFGGSARNFRAQARGLGDRVRVVRFDARGHARSEAPDDPNAYVPEAFVADVGRVLDLAGAPAAVVGGLSMGAGIALRFALAHPERTRGLVLAAFPAGAATPGSIGAVAIEFACAIEREGLDRAGARFVWGPDSGLDPHAAALIRQGFLEHAPHALAHTLRSLIGVQPTVAELVTALPAVTCPVLVIVGAQDPLAIAASRALAEALPSARLAIVPDAGHLVNVAQPAAFNAEVADFVARLPSEPGSEPTGEQKNQDDQE
jgi:pimeloyl-ACP methyl ester carboxylesterase